jgi:acyl carrier protein
MAACTSEATATPAPEEQGVIASGGTLSMEIAEKVKEIVAQQLDLDKDNIKEESDFIEDLGADSLAIVELTLAFEEQFEIEIADEDVEKIRTVGAAIEYIKQHNKA